MFTGKKVVLKAYEKHHTKPAHEGFNRYAVQRLLSPTVILPLSYTEEEQFLDGQAAAKAGGKSYSFAIETLEGQYIGGCGYFDLDVKNRHAALGISIVEPEFWGKGYGADALEVLIEFLFNEMNLRKVHLTVFSFNERAIRCYRKLGFVEEGRLREHVFREGRYEDVILMGLFRSDRAD